LNYQVLIYSIKKANYYYGVCALLKDEIKLKVHNITSLIYSLQCSAYGAEVPAIIVKAPRFNC